MTDDPRERSEPGTERIEEPRGGLDGLICEGRYADAADKCLSSGAPLRAAELFAAVWQWDRAVDAAIEAGRDDVAFEHALDSADAALIERVRRRLQASPDALLRVAGSTERKGRPAEAAVLWELAGEPRAAAVQYEAAGDWLAAGRCREAAGQYAQAGRAYERRLQQAPWDGEAGLALGRLLAQLGRLDAAVRALQKAVADPACGNRALRLLVACFDALGFRDAARDRLRRLRAAGSTAAATVGDLLEETFGDRRGLPALARRPADELVAGRYRVLRTLGAGASARVLLALDVFRDREVAIKVLTVGGGVGGRDACARFAREARIAAGVEHTNVVRVYEYHESGPFLVMEHMAGGTLEDRLGWVGGAAPRVSPDEVRSILRQVLGGLGAVHLRGVVHRDIKPANIFFTEQGAVKVGDFGAACLVDLGSTWTGAMRGTLAYMAPEQITGADPPTAATDLYAVGVLMFEMLTGSPPFAAPDMASQHLEAPVPSVAERVPGLGRRYDPLLAALLAKRPQDRVQTAQGALALMDALAWPQLERGRGGGEQVGAKSTVPPPIVERYVADGAAGRFRDTFLDRSVELLPCSEPSAPWWRRWAQAQGPHLQAVLDVDCDAGRVVLESPSGVSLAHEPPELDRDACRSQIAAALDRIHRHGLTHGQVDAEHIVVGQGGAVLLLPREGEPEEEATPEKDVASLGLVFEALR